MPPTELHPAPGSRATWPEPRGGGSPTAGLIAARSGETLRHPSPAMLPLNRRDFLRHAALTAGASLSHPLFAQTAGERPTPSADVTVLNPRQRAPVGLIIDDSTCLVNLNRFAVPQFGQARGPEAPNHKIPWRDWPVEIPDAFVRKFGEWSTEHGVKGARWTRSPITSPTR